ncbi:YcnI family copper-binding membrane protein [Amycolatopsis thermophila]|uniref:Uncharacterized protein YcnI n=1 Tax=Amycolatopsis thermophila TaxID=206084 RepID=A0ABU0ET72_9PSEU|nr:YcnI family protein [Amycolatopsis thermophila]MDQ0378115.1 uncharacterized protein YcnI [Amycolatopsis thermophila]
MNPAFIRRGAVLAGTVGVAGLLGAGIASAHVTADVLGSQPQQGGYGAITVRVPNEEEDAATVKLEIDFKPEYAISSVRYQPIPGWTAEVTKTPLPTPVKNGKNLDVTEAVTKVVFTAQPGAKIGPGETQYQDFNITAGSLPAVDELVLPAIQTYDNGETVSWDQVAADGAAEPDHPAPTVELAAASADGHSHDATTTSATTASGDSTDDTARWLGGAGLVVGALGLGAGAGAVLRGRKAAK